MKPLRGQTIPNSHEPKEKKRTKTIGERCIGRIKSGRRCKLSAIDDGYCSTHQYQKEIQDKSSAEEKKEFLEELKSSIPEDDSANLRKLVDDINMITKGIHEIEIGDFKERLSKLGYGLRTQEIAVNIVKSDGDRPFREHRGVLKRNRR